jgi:hypothetical protein
MVNKRSLNEGPKYDASSEEEEEIKFNFKLKGTQNRKYKEELGEEVVFHFKHVDISKFRTAPKGINVSDYEEEVIFNFKPANRPQVQIKITEAASEGNSEKFDDLDSTTPRRRKL